MELQVTKADGDLPGLSFLDTAKLEKLQKYSVLSVAINNTTQLSTQDQHPGLGRPTLP